MCTAHPTTTVVLLHIAHSYTAVQPLAQCTYTYVIDGMHDIALYSFWPVLWWTTNEHSSVFICILGLNTHKFAWVCISFARVLWVDYYYIGNSCSSICHCNLCPSIQLLLQKHSQLVRLVQPVYCYKETDKCDRSITDPPLSHTARWTQGECGSHRQQPTTLRCFLATHHFSNQHVCGRTVEFSFHGWQCACALPFLCNTILGFSTRQTKLYTAVSLPPPTCVWEGCWVHFQWAVCMNVLDLSQYTWPSAHNTILGTSWYSTN